ncbi:ATP-binding protein [Pseudomonas sp. NPDC089734]|uniref:ATP-binding protein n=1 Tax=Pseudomonas sp. NPDC089734 TaxID=3364469 RepID=UPI00382B500E
MKILSNRRILLIDSTPATHEDFRKALVPDSSDNPDLYLIEAALFGNDMPIVPSHYQLDCVYDSEDGLLKAQQALDEDQPYALVFVDMHLAEDVRVVEKLWQIDPRLQVVICAAQSDYSWETLIDRLQGHDRLLTRKKPFNDIEVQQLAQVLTTKWEMTELASVQMDRLEQLVAQRTEELTRTSEKLQHEIDERKNLESQLVQSEKLASLGQLAAGVAHEINNPIGFISSNLGTLENYFAQVTEMLLAYRNADKVLPASPERDRLADLHERIELDYLIEDIPLLIRESKEGIDRAGKIVKDLKAFSRADSSEQWQWADLHQGIDSTLNIAANELKYKADVIKRYGDLPQVECLSSQINQVVMNLLVNAAQAIGSERGQIIISTGQEGENVWLEVTDNGSGIEPQILQRIFDPFFTTKPVGKGTGLGLSLSYGIVKKHGGSISVKSEIGVGSSFKVMLPIHQSSGLGTARPS